MAQPHGAPESGKDMSWFENSAFYHIYPLGFCGCPEENDFSSPPEGRIARVGDISAHISALNLNALYLGPVFESSRHGYDTADYRVLDRRLGTNADFAAVCSELHSRGIKIVLDGVFNHVGRDFWAFRDVREHGWASRYKDWFHLREGNSGFNDGFFYEGWEGCFDLVRLNLANPEVKAHLFEAVALWVREFDIDGLRLDVAYCVDKGFLRELRAFCKPLKPDFFLLGETLHGDYNQWMNSEMCDSVTNYECYKGLFSSLNDMNMFEIAYSMNRQFGEEYWTLYKGKHLYVFLDNHDVSRIASLLKVPEHLSLAYALLFTMPGIPAVYYGSEWGALGLKSSSDRALRPAFSQEDVRSLGSCALAEYISKLSILHRTKPALFKGKYKQIALTSRQFFFMRKHERDEIFVALNIDGERYTACGDMHGEFCDLLTGELHTLQGSLTLPPFSAVILERMP